MNKNSYWLGYIFLILMVVISYTAFTSYKIYQHSRLTEEVTPHSLQWSIHKMAEDDYVLDSVYTFLWKGENFNGHMQDSEHFLNTWASQEALEKINKRSFTVWFDPQDPNFSTLNKEFPIKYSIYAGLLWLLFIYFVWLGNSVKNEPR